MSYELYYLGNMFATWNWLFMWSNYVLYYGFYFVMIKSEHKIFNIPSYENFWEQIKQTESTFSFETCCPNPCNVHVFSQNSPNLCIKTTALSCSSWHYWKYLVVPQLRMKFKCDMLQCFDSFLIQILTNICTALFNHSLLRIFEFL